MFHDSERPQKSKDKKACCLLGQQTGICKSSWNCWIFTPPQKMVSLQYSVFCPLLIVLRKYQSLTWKICKKFNRFLFVWLVKSLLYSFTDLGTQKYGVPQGNKLFDPGFSPIRNVVIKFILSFIASFSSIPSDDPEKLHCFQIKGWALPVQSNFRCNSW